MVTWNLSDIYDAGRTEEMLKDLRLRVETFKAHRTEMKPGLSPHRFMELFKELMEIDRINAKLNGYAMLSLSENMNDSKRLAHDTTIREVTTELGNELMFYMLWFKDLSDEDAQRYLENAGEHRYFLDIVRQFRRYTLSEREERIISIKDLTGDEALISLYEQITSKFKFNWNGKKITREEIVQYVRSPKSEERRTAYNRLLRTYKEETTLGELYKYTVNAWRNENIKLRNFSSSIAARNLGNRIPDEVVTLLLETVRKNIILFHEYFDLKAKILGMQRLSRYDIYAPYTAEVEDYPYEKSREIVLDTFRGFSPLASQMAERILTEQHVHSEILPGKRGGAYCHSILPSITPYIMLNHVGKLEDVFTMAHEFGHGIHGIAAEKQTDYTFSATLPLAETASVFAEMLLTKKLLREGTKEQKIQILMRSIEGQYATIVRQAYFVLFELAAHDMIGNGATVEELDTKYLKLLREMFGKNMEVPPIFKHEWKYIPHIYHTPFYCYAYTFGNLLVLALYRRYEQEGDAFVPQYFRILSYGASRDPEDILKEAGIHMRDPEFWQSGFDVIRDELEMLKKYL